MSDEAINNETPLGGESELNEEQKKVLGDVMRRLASKKEPMYLYIGGAAGTGKSVLIDAIRRKINEIYVRTNACVVTAPIGVASVGIEAFFTIYALFRIKGSDDQFSSIPSEKIYAYANRISGTEVVIVDEINLVEPIRLAKIDHRLQELTGNRTVFGGMSVIVAGDLLQVKFSERNSVFNRITGENLLKKREATPSSPDDLWSMFSFVELTENMRTSAPNESKILEGLRTNNIPDTVKLFLREKCLFDESESLDVGQIFETLKTLQQENPEKTFMILAPKKSQVEKLNLHKLEKLGEEENVEDQQWEPIPSEGTDDETSAEFQYGDREVIKLTVGCKVIITRNTDACYNGDYGIVVRMDEDAIVVRLQNRETTVFVTRVGWKKTSENGTEFWSQFPVRLSFAMTIHSAKGMTFDGVILITEEIFGKGAFYTGLSRARSLALSRITCFNWRKWTVSQSAIDELNRLRALQNA